MESNSPKSAMNRGARSPSQIRAVPWSPAKSVASSDSGKVSETGQGKCLPLVDCPTCGIPVIKLRSKTKLNPNRIFYKRENNVQNDPNSRCGFYKWENEYENYLAGREMQSGSVEMQAEEEVQLVDLLIELKKQNTYLRELLCETKLKRKDTLFEVKMQHLGAAFVIILLAVIVCVCQLM